MKLKIIILFMSACYLLLSGCTKEEVSFGPKTEVTAYSEEKLIVDNLIELSIESDYSNIEVYTWDRDETKFEITKRVRGIYKKEILNEKLKDFSIVITPANNKILYKSKYKGSIKSPADKSADIKVYMPKKVRLMSCKLGLGTLKIHDDIKGELRIDTDTANIEINRIVGKASIKGNMGNVRISSGRLESGSSIIEKLGSIYIKAELEEAGEYMVETGVGNIDLLLPAYSKASFESIGDVQINEFEALFSTSKMRLKSDMGKISIMKY